MKPIPVDQLIKIIGGECVVPGSIDVCEGVSIDSRTLIPGQAFFAISGQRFDGHEYINTAVDKGASCAIVSCHIDMTENSDVQVIRVDDTVNALGRLAEWYRQQLSAKVIGITGSVGKTTTRQILYQVLRRSCRCHQAEKSFNNHIGLPLTILSAEPEDDILLLELGTNSPGEIESLARIAQPDMALITLVGPAHLEGFGSIENILREKASIAKGLKKDGVLYVNGDQPKVAGYIKEQYDVSCVTFGTSLDCDIQGQSLAVSGCAGSLAIEGETVDVPLAGHGNLMNVLGAWALCQDLDISLSDFSRAVKGLELIQMRMETQHVGSLTILNDCYNANPISMNNALACLNEMGMEANKRKVFIAGCMAELGEQSSSLHLELGRQSTRQGIDLVLASGPFADEIVTGACGTIAKGFATTEQLCDNLHKWIKADDIILVKGSRAACLERAIERLWKLFADSSEKAAKAVTD